MDTKKIFTLVGGISHDSLNKKLFNAVRERVPSGYEIATFDIQSLPFFSQDLENDPPDVVESYKDLIREADAILFITPEYNRSFPGVLKNAIDWGSRPYGKNLWDKKTAAVMGASSGNIGTFGAQHHLRQVMAYLNMVVLGQPEFYLNGSRCFNDKGQLIDTKTAGFIEKFWQTYSQWIELQLTDQNAHLISHKSRGLEDAPLGH